MKYKTMAAAMAATALVAGCGAGSGAGSSTHYTVTNNPCVNSRLANGNWQQTGETLQDAIAGAVDLCSLGAGFNKNSDPSTKVGPNTSGWSWPRGCGTDSDACLNR